MRTVAINVKKKISRVGKIEHVDKETDSSDLLSKVQAKMIWQCIILEKFTPELHYDYQIKY